MKLYDCFMDKNTEVVIRFTKTRIKVVAIGKANFACRYYGLSKKYHTYFLKEFLEIVSENPRLALDFSDCETADNSRFDSN